MEFGRMANGLKEKCVLITGSTGFLGKIFVEKVLRVQPDVKRLYLLVRATETKSAAQRIQSEVIETELFHLLRDKHGEEFHSFVSDKVSAIAGDIIQENLGIEDTNLIELLWNDINMIINVAATTKFYDRYDVALNVNVLGAKNTMNFAKRCKNLQVFLHVSTEFPADMVANAMIAMVATHTNQNGEFIHHISSSTRNLVTYSVLVHSFYRYFAENPRIGRNGKPIKLSKLPMFRTLTSFYVLFSLRYRLPLEMLRLVNIMMCCLLSKKYKELSRKYKFVTRLIDLYMHY